MAHVPNVRECNLCHRMVDFGDPFCAHESMEESAWLDIQERQRAAATASIDNVIDEQVRKAATELGLRAAKDFHKMIRAVYDAEVEENLNRCRKEEHLSDLDHVYQHRSQQ